MSPTSVTFQEIVKITSIGSLVSRFNLPTPHIHTSGSIQTREFIETTTTVTSCASKFVEPSGNYQNVDDTAQAQELIQATSESYISPVMNWLSAISPACALNQKNHIRNNAQDNRMNDVSKDCKQADISQITTTAPPTTITKTLSRKKTPKKSISERQSASISNSPDVGILAETECATLQDKKRAPKSGKNTTPPSASSNSVVIVASNVKGLKRKKQPVQDLQSPAKTIWPACMAERSSAVSSVVEEFGSWQPVPADFPGTDALECKGKVYLEEVTGSDCGCESHSNMTACNDCDQTCEDGIAALTALDSSLFCDSTSLSMHDSLDLHFIDHWREWMCNKGSLELNDDVCVANYT
jgi:hypothetical protein